MGQCSVLSAQCSEVVAALLAYPVGPMRDRVHDAMNVLADVPEARNEVVAFWDEVEHVTAEGMEELYTLSFDLNPMATLEVGWHLWGEQYERGRFLADLRQLQAEQGIDAGTELPDHLTSLLPLIARMERPAALPLIEQTRKGIEKILEPLEKNGNPYRHLVRAAQAVLRSDS